MTSLLGNFRFLALFLSVISCGVPTSANCPELCDCDDVNLVVTCIKADLEALPNTLNPTLKTLALKYNEFPTIHFSLSFLPQLLNVDLSHNKIVTISDGAFRENRELLQLQLEGNKIGSVSNKTFYGLRNLQVLSLRGNNIEALPERLFGYNPRLAKLDLARNRISDINIEALRGLNSLEILRLEDNSLTSVPLEALRSVPNLAELYLAGNPLTVIEPRSFAHFNALTSLDISSCRLRGLDDLALQGLGTLRTLKLADNNLASVPSEALRSAPNLESLDVGRNGFSVILGGAFRFTPGLKRVEISGCGSLTSISSGAFSGCSDLEKVSITDNRLLGYIADDAFGPLPELKQLSVSGNGLESVSERLVPWRQLRSLDLSSNPWRCDCDLSFLAGPVRSLMIQAEQFNTLSDLGDVNANAVEISEGKCASPPQFEHRWLSEIEEDKLDCRSNEIDSVVKEPQSDTSSSHSHSPSEKKSSSSSSRNAVIIYICASAVTAVILLILVVAAFHRRRELRDWAKTVRWQHEARRRKGGHFHPAEDDPYLRSDHLQHQQQYSSSAHNSPQPSLPTEFVYSCDDEHYYYVPTMQNRFGQGKAIPVTEL